MARQSCPKPDALPGCATPRHPEAPSFSAVSAQGETSVRGNERQNVAGTGEQTPEQFPNRSFEKALTAHPDFSGVSGDAMGETTLKPGNGLVKDGGAGKRRLFRVQDKTGRGPYIPGFSHRWSSPDGPRMRPWWEEIGVSVGKAILMLPDRMHVGCAFASMEQLHNWFLPEELRKLAALGFHLVEPLADRIICETPTQVVFATRNPFFEMVTKPLPKGAS